VWGITLLQKGFPHKAYDSRKHLGKRKSDGSKKSAILRIADKKAQAYKSDKVSGNE
jgi:hypothetical protein